MHPQIYCVQSHQCFSAPRVLDSRRVESRWWFFIVYVVYCRISLFILLYCINDSCNCIRISVNGCHLIGIHSDAVYVSAASNLPRHAFRLFPCFFSSSFCCFSSSMVSSSRLYRITDFFSVILLTLLFKSATLVTEPSLVTADGNCSPSACSHSSVLFLFSFII